MSTKPDTDTGWSKDDPKVDGVYWWRADANDSDPDIHSVVNGRFYEVGMSQCTVVENFGGEWLGPFTASDFEQLIRLRKLGIEARDVLALLVPYGKIHTVEGVRYPDGTHSEAVDRGEVLLNQLRDVVGRD